MILLRADDASTPLEWPQPVDDPLNEGLVMGLQGLGNLWPPITLVEAPYYTPDEQPVLYWISLV